MTALAARVLRAVRAAGLIGPGDRVVVAVSGGPDSVALLHLLREMAPSLGADVVAAAHLHHGLRGEAADADEQFCREMASRLGVPIVVEHADVGTLARGERLSLEHAGHVARARFYARAMEQAGATLVATGHTRDDQAETVLLRVLRGAGTRGLGGIHPRRGRVVRPLLGVARAEIARYLAARSLPSRDDATNRDVRIARNRVRHEVLPLVERRFSPRVGAALARTAALARDDEACLAALAREASGRLVRESPEGLAIARDGLCALATALARRVVREALGRVATRAVGAAQVDQALGIALRGRPGAMLDLPRVRLRLSPDAVTLTARAGVAAPASAGSWRSSPAAAAPLPVPGALCHAPSGRVVSADLLGPGDVQSVVGAHGAPGDLAAVDAARVGPALFVRSRRPGDWLRPAGLGGRKKLQDLFVDRKVPRAERDRVPIVVDAHDRVVWVAGHSVSEEFGVTPATTGVLLLRVSP